MSHIHVEMAGQPVYVTTVSLDFILPLSLFFSTQGAFSGLLEDCVQVIE